METVEKRRKRRRIEETIVAAVAVYAGMFTTLVTLLKVWSRRRRIVESENSWKGRI